MELKVWVFVETREGGHRFIGSAHETKEECVEHYEDLCARKNPSFGKEGETVQYVKLTGEMK